MPGQSKNRTCSPKSSCYTEDTMQEAREAVISKRMGLREAAKYFGVPVTSLRTRIKRISGPLKLKNTAMSASVEAELVAWIQESARSGSVQSKLQIRQKSQKILMNQGVVTIFKNNLPGTTWVKNFFKRHPDLPIHKTARVQGYQPALCAGNEAFDDDPACVKPSPSDLYPISITTPVSSHVTSALKASPAFAVTTSTSSAAVDAGANSDVASLYPATSVPSEPLLGNHSSLEALERLLEVTASAGVEGLFRYRAGYTFGFETSGPEERLYRLLYCKIRGHLNDIIGITVVENSFSLNNNNG